MVNPFGFIQRTKYLPDRRDLNRSFPGSATGSLASRLAHLFMEQIRSYKTYWVRATMSGIFEKRVSLGSLVHKSDLLGIQSDPLGDDTAKLFSPLTGVVIG